MTEANSEGISEVFHTLHLPEDLVPEGMIARWNSIVDASPIQSLKVVNKDNVVVGSTYDSSTETFTAPSDKPKDSIIPPKKTSAQAFLINNVVVGLLMPKLQVNGILEQKFNAGFAAPVTVKGIGDSDPIDLGYTWDGTTFTAPVEN